MPANSPPSPAGRWLRGAALGVALAAALLAVGEGTLRLAGRLSSGVWPETREAALYGQFLELRRIYRGHAYLNTAPRSGGHAEALGKSVTLNEGGYRSPARPRERPPGIERVVVAGGSTTFDVLAEDDAATWPQRLEAALREAGRPAEVWNAGFPGWTSQENVIALAIRDLDLRPDLVVLYQGLNDLQPGSHVPLDPQYETGHAEVTRRALGLELAPLPWTHRLLLRERLLGVLRGPQDPWSMLASPGGAATVHPRLAGAASEVFARNLRSFAALARSGGASAMFVTQPVRVRAATRAADEAYLASWLPELEPGAVPAALASLNETTRRVARETGVALADAAAEISWTDDDFGDPMHYTASGRAKLVAYLAPCIGAELAARHP